MKATIKQIQTEVSKGSITNVRIAVAFGGGVMNVTEVMICGFEKKTASDLSFVIVRLPNPISAFLKKFEKLISINIIKVYKFLFL
jgi:predicted PP-loop superfamily ATPase